MMTTIAGRVYCRGKGCPVWEDWEEEQVTLHAKNKGIQDGWSAEPRENKIPDHEDDKLMWIYRINYKGEGECGLKTKHLECGS